MTFEMPQSMCSTVRWSDGASRMQSSCFKFLTNKTFCDCTLKTDDGKEIYGHRVILASTSLYFRKKLMEYSANQVLRIPSISYVNLCLIVKFAYTGEVTMAENRLAGFLRDAKALELFKAPDDYKVTQKPRNETERKQKRVRSKVSDRTANKRAADDDLQASDCKKRKPEFADGDWGEDNNTQPAMSDDSRKRKPSPEELSMDAWGPQPPKRSRMGMIACHSCFQSFSNMSLLDHHKAFCNYVSSDDDSEDFDYEDCLQ